MMDPDAELRIWIAVDGSNVVGVLPFASERMRRNQIRLLPPVTDMMYGIVPIADQDRTEEIIAAIAEDFAARPMWSTWQASSGSQRDHRGCTLSAIVS